MYLCIFVLWYEIIPTICLVIIFKSISSFLWKIWNIMCIFFSTFNFWCLTFQKKTLFWLKILALKSSSSRRTNQFPLLSAPKGNEPAAITELPSTSIIIAVLSICQGFLNEWNKTFFTNHLTKEWKPHKLDKVSAQYKCLGGKFSVDNFRQNLLVGNIAY